MNSINRDFYINVEKRTELIDPIHLNLKEDSIILYKEIYPGVCMYVKCFYFQKLCITIVLMTKL